MGDFLTDLSIYIIRSVIVIAGTWLVTNFIGKKSIAQLTPYEIAILFILSNVGAQPLVSIDTFKTAFGMVILGISIILISKVSLSKLFYGMNAEPAIVVSNGQIDRMQLKKNRMSIYSLLSMLRVQGYFKVEDVEYAILEPSGDLSVLPKVSARPLTPEDLNLKPEQDTLSYAVIIDGDIKEHALASVQQTKEWLINELMAQYKTASKDVLYAEADSQGNLFANIKKSGA
ncbi:DUF421 domain-containing protein [Metabacillus indicus]|uniref:DUF421 domain-containing protein n=1 Tax=Metabacillus indicus TaxID=246786 RepID=UPI003CECD162